MKKFFTNIYRFLTAPVFIDAVLRFLKVLIFLSLIVFVGPWLWIRLDPAVTISTSYLEFVCASILCWIILRRIIEPKKYQQSITIEEKWFED